MTSTLITGQVAAGKTRFATDLILQISSTGRECFALYGDMTREQMYGFLGSFDKENTALITVCSKPEMELSEVFEATNWDIFDTLLIDGIESLIDINDAKKVEDFLLMVRGTKTNFYMTLPTNKTGSDISGSMLFLSYFDYIIEMRKSRFA